MYIEGGEEKLLRFLSFKNFMSFLRVGYDFIKIKLFFCGVLYLSLIFRIYIYKYR